MSRLRVPALWLVPPLGAVAVFAALLGFSLVRMTEIESDMRIGAERNMLWVTHQGEVAARRLSETALLAGAERADAGELRLRYDILGSRMALMNDGPQRRFVEQAGLAEELDRLRAELAALAPRVTDFTRTDAAALHGALAPFAAFFGRAANQAMITEWDDLGGRLESYRAQLRQIIAWLIGIMGAGGTLTVLLVLALRQSRQRNRMLARERDFSALLISSSGEGIMAVDHAGRCTLWNEAMTGLFGRPVEQAVGRDAGDLAGFFATRPVQEALAGACAGQSARLSLQPLFRPEDSAPLHVDLRIFPMQDRNRIIGAIAFIQDASDRHAARQQEEATRARLERLVAARTRELDEALMRERSAADLYRNFAAMISHQFRTPLAVADSALQRLIRRGAQAEAEEIATRATRAREVIAGLTRLVESTLDAARRETGQHGAHRRPCDPARILRDLCARRPDAPESRIVVTGGGSALGDPAHVEQILDNLLSNALRHAPPGSPVSVHLHGDAKRLFCDIHNGGAPIAPADRAHLFERGFRGANSGGMPGTGTGLFIARALARMQGGDVVLLPGDSVAFRLILPRPPEGVSPAHDLAQGPATGERDTTGSSGATG
ncbi:sensor histidine kinase [Pontibaca methylaminivorans]|uniref:histidine kinase n=1 Tax=Pontibaca methylaminivorans TaxID=515897 RepID=A0A1R3X8E9_9RHOB|nr:ATP-binding protein [Pontibaca methylaminivorans]SIT87031.1 PAS domain S-box-containing protein [Pontibaca methylaminivorans]